MYGLKSKEESFGDFLHGISFDDELQDLPLAGGQFWQSLLGVRQDSLCLLADILFSVSHDTDAIDELIGIGVLQDITLGTVMRARRMTDDSA